MRLDKFISSQYPDISRKNSRELIRSGKVLINGLPCLDPEFKVLPDSDSVSLFGKNVDFKPFLYIMLNKPAGIVCATRDRLSETVLEIIPPELRRPGLFPAGRLDKDTVGFVLITDDGALAHSILSPKSHVRKKYFVRLRDPLPQNCAEIFADGISLDGERLLPAELEKVSEKDCFLTIREGKYHQIKRMFEAVGNEVVYLKRLEIAGVALDPELSEGKCRELTEAEINVIRSAKNHL